MGIDADLRTVALRDEAATLALGAALSAQVNEGIVYLQGPLGAGKTTLVRGFLRALGYEGLVKSPTYTLIEPYELTERRIAHIDLYRVNDPAELDFIGLEDVLQVSELVFVEWPERGGDYVPKQNYGVRFEVVGKQRRALLSNVTP